MAFAQNVDRRPAASWASGTPILPFIAYSGLCFAIFGAIKFGLSNGNWGTSAGSETFLWASTLVLIGLSIHVRMADLPRPMAIMLGFFFASFAAYMAFPLTLPDDATFNALTDIRLRYRQFIFPILCLLGFWRPAFGAAALFGAVCERRTLEDWFGDTLSATEFFPLAEIGIFLVIAAAIEKYALRNHFLGRAAVPVSADDTLPLLTKITLVGVCLHLSNYFYSGLAKAMLGDHPLSWMIHNHTENMIPAHLEFGQLPLSVSDGLPELSYTGFGYVFILINAFTFFGQLLAIVAALRIRWIVAITAFYDLTHLAIFLVTGIFFYKWILLNFSIIAAFGALRAVSIPRQLQAYMVAIVVAAPALFSIAHLAWWDTLSVDNERILAVLDDGTEVPVPSNYWGSFSVHYAQQRRSPELAAMLFPSRYGKPKSQRMAELANRCEMPLPPDSGSTEVPVSIADPDGSISAHVRSHHFHMLTKLDDAGRVDYDFYPHHIWSMPWLFRPFEQLDKHRIRAYRFTVQAVCLGLENGKFSRKVIREKSFVIPVAG